jgi:hypothetical protein
LPTILHYGISRMRKACDRVHVRATGAREDGAILGSPAAPADLRAKVDRHVRRPDPAQLRDLRAAQLPRPWHLGARSGPTVLLAFFSTESTRRIATARVSCSTRRCIGSSHRPLTATLWPTQCQAQIEMSLILPSRNVPLGPVGKVPRLARKTLAGRWLAFGRRMRSWPFSGP